MAPRPSRMAAVLGLSAVLGVVAGPARADSLLIGAWDFHDMAVGAVAPGTGFGDPVLYAAADRTTLAVVEGPRGGVLDVASWRGLAPGVAVPRSASMLSTDPTFWVQTPWGSDGASQTFDPGLDDFAVSVWLRPTDAAAFPRGSKPVGSVSPNVVQKGRSTETGGFWKVGLQMVRTAQGLAWAPECALRGRDGVVAVANRFGTVVTLTPGVGAQIKCARVGDELALTVVGDDGSMLSSSVRGAGALEISNRAAVSVAHKPGTTSARDVYDGLLTGLVITRG